MSYAYLNGQIVEESKASVPVTNFGLLRGLGIFDLFRARNGKPTFLEDYLNRFANSQKFLNLNRAITADEVREAVDELQKKNAFAESTFKLVLTGQGEDTDLQFEPHFFILNTQLPDGLKSAPSSVITYEYLREYPEIKTLNYLTGYSLQQRRINARAADVLYHKDGFITETSRSNVFIIKDGTIATPNKNILQGITRKNLLQLIQEEYTLEIRPVELSEIQDANEFFICSTIKEVMPIVKIDNQEIGNGKAGKITQEIQRKFQELVSA